MNKDIMARLLALEAESRKGLKVLTMLADGTEKTVGVEDFINLYQSGMVVAVDFPTVQKGCGMLPELITGLVMEAN